MVDDTTHIQDSDSTPRPVSAAGVVSPEIYSIHVVGAMNPAIHHPIWYQNHSLLLEAEAAGALPSLITSPAFALFSFDGYSILCNQERWTISTSDANRRPRLLEIAARIFDHVLAQTPVSSFALNNGFHRALTIDARTALARVLLKSGLPHVPRPDSAAFTFEADGPNGSRISLRIEPSIRSAAEVFVAVDSTYPIQDGRMIEFSLRPLLERSYDSDLNQAQLYVRSLVEVLNSLGGGTNARSGR